MARFSLESSTEERNQLLAAIPASEFAMMDGALEDVELEIDALLIEPDRPVRYVYFPSTALGSMVTSPGGQMVEAASIGREGFVGLPALFGSTTTTTTIVQVAGKAQRIRAELFVELLHDAPTLAGLLRRYALALFDQAAHTAACNRAHPVVERCAKWLLVIADRVAHEEFKITHKYLAIMLGVRRAGVTIAAGTLQKAGAIAYARGKIRIVDREKLKQCACECYPILTTISGSVLDSIQKSGSGRKGLSLS